MMFATLLSKSSARESGFCRLWLLAILLLLCCSGCKNSAGATCQGCHAGLELVSNNHPDCVSCHGGDPTASDKERSHRGMLGPGNPSDPAHWEQSCGRCHAYQWTRVKSSLMTTNRGMIHNIMTTWEGPEAEPLAAQAMTGFAADGTPLDLQGIANVDHLSAELYRKFCSLCHVGRKSTDVYAASHASGCAACHFPYNEVATYQGSDPTVKGKWGYSASHEMAILPENKVCSRCHNRSGRIALTYEGLNDGNNGLVPSRDGLPGPEMISGARNITHIAPDIHHAQGMECIDCHTSREIMGDGYSYRNMYQQTEVRCEDCHGGAQRRPLTARIVRENDEVLRESRNYPQPYLIGSEMVLTAKGRSYSNVALMDGQVQVQGKRKGKQHLSKVITGTPEHTIVGHERLACTSCHSQSVAQCYGCHTSYDQSQLSEDFILGRKTPGLFSETEDLRQLYPFPLAFDQRGEIAPVTPGCQTFVSVLDSSGQPVRQEEVSLFQGKRQFRFAPFFGHSVGAKALTCESCHSDPRFLGFGQQVALMDGSLEPLVPCERNPDNPLDGFLRLEQGQLAALGAITREQSRPFRASEIKKIWQVNLCLLCHDNPKDPIYQSKLDVTKLADCLDRTAAEPR